MLVSVHANARPGAALVLPEIWMDRRDVLRALAHGLPHRPLLSRTTVQSKPTLNTTDWRDFFDTHKDYLFEGRFYECARAISLEELYQAFKARLEHERKSEECGF